MSFQQAVKQFLPSPIDEDLSKHRLSDMEWSVLQDYEAILAVSFSVNQRSGRPLLNEFRCLLRADSPSRSTNYIEGNHTDPIPHDHRVRDVNEKLGGAG